MVDRKSNSEYNNKYNKENSIEMLEALIMRKKKVRAD